MRESFKDTLFLKRILIDYVESSKLYKPIYIFHTYEWRATFPLKKHVE